MAKSQQPDVSRFSAKACRLDSDVNLSQALSDSATDKRLAILRAVASTGSISEAARQVGVSYKSAWQAIETLTNLAGTTLVEKVVGGPGGGGARLTLAGESLLRASAQWQTLQQAWFKQFGYQALNDSRASFAAVGLSMQTSMRNQWPVTVEQCEVADGRSRVELRLSDGQKLWAQITPESQQLLGLAPGLSVLAMCKASAVSVSSEQGSPSNCLRGQVRRSEGDSVVTASAKTKGCSVSVQVSRDVCLVGYWDDDGVAQVGGSVSVCIDPMAVVIAREMATI